MRSSARDFQDGIYYENNSDSVTHMFSCGLHVT